MNNILINRVFCSFCRKELVDLKEIDSGHHRNCMEEIDKFTDDFGIIRKIENELKIKLFIYTEWKENGEDHSFYGEGYVIDKDKKVIKLGLKNKNIDHIPDCVFDLVHLEELDASYNNIKNISPKIINLSKLKILDLYKNSIKKLPDNFKKLKSLIDLDIGYNSFTAFPIDIDNLNLEELTIGHINYPFPESLSLPKLRRLFISKLNYGSQIPNAIFSMKNLEILSISDLNHQIHSLPAQIKNLTNLKLLSLINFGEGHLRHIHNNICKLEKLETLKLSQNKINKLPQDITKLKNLIGLNLNSNNFEEFPQNLLKMDNLEYIMLKNNLINRLPENIEELCKSKHVDLSNNPRPLS